VLEDALALHGVRAAQGDIGQRRVLDGRDLQFRREQVDDLVAGSRRGRDGRGLPQRIG